MRSDVFDYVVEVEVELEDELIPGEDMRINIYEAVTLEQESDGYEYGEIAKSEAIKKTLKRLRDGGLCVRGCRARVADIKEEIA